VTQGARRLCILLLSGALLAGCSSSGQDQLSARPSATTPTTPRSPVTLTSDQDQALRAAVGERLHDESITADPAALRFETATPARLDAIVMFRAVYGEGENIGVLQGTLDTGSGAINTFPNDALVQVWQRWIDTGGLPDAIEVTKTSMFLIGGVEKKTVVLSEADREHAADESDRAKVQLPRLLEKKKGPGVVFWWLRGNKLSEVTLRLDRGIIGLSERDVSKV
jgi:hypothetical protein